MLDPEAVITLARQCAPGVAAPTLLALARAESGLEPLAIGVNGPSTAFPKPKTAAEAVGVAKSLIAGGRDIDLGLAQISVRNLARLGLSLEGAFDPCRNLAAAARVLHEGYDRGRARHGPGQAALRVALSVYNTGHVQRGFANGYVARVLSQTHQRPRPTASAPRAPEPISARASTPAARPATWDVFSRAQVRGRLVISAEGATP